MRNHDMPSPVWANPMARWRRCPMALMLRGLNVLLAVFGKGHLHGLEKNIGDCGDAP